MATRGQLRARLRRLIHEEEEDQWTDLELNEALNESLQSIQEFIMALDPEAFVVWQTKKIEKNVRYYQRPVDIVYDLEVGYSDNPDASDYAPLDKKDFSELRSYDGGRSYTEAASSGCYAKVGAYYYLGWNPDKEVERGLQVVYVPWLVMDQDEDVPAISLGYHRLIYLDAAVKILSDTPEDTSKLEKERSEFWDKIRLYYRSSATKADVISLDLHKSY